MPTPIDTYLANLPQEQSATLQKLRTLLNTLLPDAEETIRTRVPALQYRGKTVVGFGAAKTHLALYVMFGKALHTMKDDFADFDTSDRVVRFTPATPIPATLVRKVVRLRVAEIDAQAAKR